MYILCKHTLLTFVNRPAFTMDRTHWIVETIIKRSTAESRTVIHFGSYMPVAVKTCKQYRLEI